MYIKNLAIRDFGPLSNQNLSELNSGLVVIGGLNRAGKTTTLKLLRHLGYGLPRDNSIPPARNEYDIQADYHWQGQDYNLSVQGYGQPQVNNLTTGERAENIYDKLDSYIYQQLFTISLEELYQLPDQPKQQKRLQSILLGAGLSDILEIQSLKDEFQKQAEEIGGKNGSPNVYQFKEYNHQIKDGIKFRKEAQGQLAQYQSLEEDLQATMEQIRNEEARVERLQADVRVLDLLKNNYQEFEQERSLRLQLRRYDYELEEEKYSSSNLEEAQRLKGKYNDLHQKLKEQCKMIREETGVEAITNLQQQLMAREEQLTELSYNLSRLEERIDNYWQHKEELKTRQKEIIRKLKEENRTWDNFTVIDEIKVDKEAQDRLKQTVNQWQKLKNRYEQKQTEVTNLKQEKNRIESELNALDEVSTKHSLQNYYFVAASFAGVGITAALVFNLWLGILLALVGIIGGAINYSSTYLLNSNQVAQQQSLKAKLKSFKERIAASQDDLETIKEKRDIIAAEVKDYRQQLKLSEEASGELIKDRFVAVKNFKQHIAKWREEKQKLQDHKEELLIELHEIQTLLSSFSIMMPNIFNKDKQDLIKVSERLITSCRELIEYLELIKKLTTLQEKERKLITAAADLVDKDLTTDEVMIELTQFIEKCKDYKQFKKLKEEKNTIQMQLEASLNHDLAQSSIEKSDLATVEEEIITSFITLFNNYSSVDEVNEDYQLKKKELNSAQENLAKLRDQQIKLKKQKDDLASSDKLEQAQKKINQGRKSLKPLAEKFAVRRAASFILDKVQAKFIDKVEDEMLAPASNILARLTSGEYQQIMPHNDLSRVDFKLQSENNSTAETIANLSRGTKEQLFLAVRMSRIAEIDPNLPVILDDSLVNFDLFHQQQVIKELVQLATDHQIFILTCHPQLIKLFKEYQDQVQYWRLKEGNFNLTTANDLINHLSINKNG